MARSISSALKTAIYAQETGETLYSLIKIEHASLSPTKYYCNAQADITSGGQVYTAAGFNIYLPADTDGAPPRVTLEVDAVDREIIDIALSLGSPPTLTASWVLASSPNTVEVGPFQYLIDDVAYDAVSLKATLTFEPVLDEPIPADRFTPVTFPGIFK